MIPFRGSSVAISFTAVAVLWSGAVGAQSARKPYERSIPVRSEEGPEPIRVGDVTITYGGFLKLDVLYSSFSDGDVASLSAGRDYFLANTIPVAAAGAEDSHAFLDYHVKDTRFFFKIDSDVGSHTLGGLLELDFRSPANGASEVVTNAWNPRLRRAFVSWNAWTLGQDWTTFRNLDSTPDHIDDLVGPSQGTVLVRQPLVRYRWAGFSFSLENNEANVLPFGGATPAFVTGDAQLPDLHARYDLKGGFGSYSLAAMVRPLEADGAATGGAAPNDVATGSATAWGLSVSGKAPSFGKDDIRFTLTVGDGVGRYVAAGTITDAVVDAGGGLETIPLVSSHVSYRHPWSARWRSNLSVGYLQADNDAALTGGAVTRTVQSVHLNLIYTPVDRLLFGVEAMHATREIENGNEGDLDRLQFSAKYTF
jgi:hypothetical protein